MKVLLIGSNPSEKSPDNSPFRAETRSRKFIDEWFRGMNVDVRFENVSNMTRPGNREMRVSEIRDNLSSLHKRIEEHGGDCKIVALGRTAARALDMLELEYLHMPHPSGLNRFWNDQYNKKQAINKLRKYIEGDDG